MSSPSFASGVDEWRSIVMQLRFSTPTISHRLFRRDHAVLLSRLTSRHRQQDESASTHPVIDVPIANCDNFLSGELLGGYRLKKERMSAKAAISYWKYGKEYQQHPGSHTPGGDRWMEPTYMRLIDENPALYNYSQLPMSGTGLDLQNLHELMCATVSSHFIDSYFITSRPEFCEVGYGQLG